MSFWGATVITSLATVVPVVGKSIVYWLWGGFSIDHPTLNRFYSFHYMLPFVLAALSIFHIAALHQYGSTNPLGVNSSTSSIPFGIYFTSKDFLGFLFLLFLYGVLVFFYPEWLGHPDNLIPANPYATPQHIVPEWYFLWVYAILRSIPNKAMGVVAIALTFASLICLPFFTDPVRKFDKSKKNYVFQSPRGFRLLSERFYWVFVADVCLLSWLGGQEIMPATVLLGQICTFVLFLYLLVIYPLVPVLENSLSNNEQVLGAYLVSLGKPLTRPKA